MILSRKQQYYNDYLNALLVGKWANCSDIIFQYLSEYDNSIELYEDIIKKSMYEIGHLWEFNKISVASEHLASSITESIINRIFYNIIPYKQTNKQILLACVEKEQHQIGLKMVADVFERYGWSTQILGANTPVKDLINMTYLIKPDIIGLSVTLHFDLPNLEKMISQIREQFPDIPIIIGGQAFTRGGYEAFTNFSNIQYFPDLFSIEEYIKQ